MLSVMTPWGDRDERDDATKALIYEVWEMIPEEERKLIVDAFFPIIVRYVRFILCYNINNGDSTSDVFGRTLIKPDMSGVIYVQIAAEIVEVSEVLRQRPFRSQLRHTVAHELAHVLQFAKGWEMSENGADAIARGWGIPKYRLRGKHLVSLLKEFDRHKEL